MGSSWIFKNCFSPFHSEPLLFVNVDISNCFDSIDTKKLYQTLEKLMQRREFYANVSTVYEMYYNYVWCSFTPAKLLDQALCVYCR